MSSYLSILLCFLNMHLTNHKSMVNNDLLQFLKHLNVEENRKKMLWKSAWVLLVEMHKSLPPGDLTKSLSIEINILWISHWQASILFLNKPWIEWSLLLPMLYNGESLRFSCSLFMWQNFWLHWSFHSTN